MTITTSETPAHSQAQLREVKVIRHFRGMLATAAGEVIGFRGRTLGIVRPPFDKFEPIAQLPGPMLGLLRRNRRTARLLRLEVYRMVRTPSGADICASREGILRRAPDAKYFEVALQDFQGRRPISLCSDSEGRVYFGEYFNNPEREAVRIFMSEDDGASWDVCYTFAPKAVRHIHGLEYDPHRNKIWLMSGDYGDEAQIGVAEPCFTDYRIVSQGDARFVACAGVPLADTFVYGTDAPFDENIVIRLDPETGEPAVVADLPHAVFFMGQACGGVFLSTVVEPSELNTTQSVHVWHSPDGHRWSEVLVVPGDGWDLRLFQYPCAFIAQGPPECPYVFLSFRGVQRLDDHCMVAQIDTADETALD